MISALDSGVNSVWVQALAGDIVLRSWASHLLSQYFSLPRCMNGVLANLMLGVTLQWTSIPSRAGGGNRNTPGHFMLPKLE